MYSWTHYWWDTLYLAKNTELIQFRLRPLKPNRHYQNFYFTRRFDGLFTVDWMMGKSNDKRLFDRLNLVKNISYLPLCSAEWQILNIWSETKSWKQAIRNPPLSKTTLPKLDADSQLMVSKIFTHQQGTTVIIFFLNALKLLHFIYLFFCFEICEK